MAIRWVVRLLVGSCLMVTAASCASDAARGGSEPVGVAGGGASVPSVPLPTPRVITRHGVRYQVSAVAPAVAMRDASNPDLVKVFVFQSEDASHPECSELSPLARVADQNANAVVVAAFAYRKPSTGKVGCVSIRSVNSPPAYAKLTLHLREPLGSRMLIDAKTGRVIAIAERQLPPTPSYMPTGYQQSLVEPFDASSDFLAIRQYHAGDRTLEIRLRSATAWAQDGTVVDKLDVAGHTATVTDQSYERCLTWSDSDNLIREVCSLATTSNYLSADQLLRIADSLHP